MTTEQHLTTTAFGIALATAGLAIGWLVGLSASPGVSAVTGALLTAAIAAISAAKQTSNQGGDRKAVLPFVAMSVAIAFAATAGTIARAHGLLGKPLSLRVEELTHLGMHKEEALRAVAASPLPAYTEPHLFAVPGISACVDALRYHDANITNAALGSSSPVFQRLGAAIKDPGTLRTAIAAICDTNADTP